MHPILTVLAACYGAVAGVFVPRAVYRLAVEPEQQWRAACPEGHPITGPAGGWLGLARCAVPAHTAPAGLPDAHPDGTSPAATVSTDPTDPTGPNAPTGPGTSAARDRPRGVHAYGPPAVIVALLTSLVCAMLSAAVGKRPELAVWLLLAPVAVALALVDTAVKRLPDVLTLSLAAGAATLLGMAALLPDSAGSWVGALLGGCALGGVYGLLFLIHPSGMGFGDVKLALGLGTVLGWYGWAVLFTGTFAGFLLGAVYGVGLIVLRRAGRKTAVPFGPFMLTGALLGLLLGGFAS
ncbi:prepilin peptidase [Streptomyces sp. NPDC001922]|uniref:prepilin peptidase n=1 Tax=Streptomyces sp. NPDC001922 TaxID=3364624 RepID=UPI0036D09DEB